MTKERMRHYLRILISPGTIILSSTLGCINNVGAKMQLEGTASKFHTLWAVCAKIVFAYCGVRSLES